MYNVFQLTPRPCVAIGEKLLDLTQVLHLFNSKQIDPTRAKELFDRPNLNTFVDQSPQIWHEVRVILRSILDADNPILRDDQELRQRCFYDQNDVRMHLPVKIGWSLFEFTCESECKIGIFTLSFYR